MLNFDNAYKCKTMKLGTIIYRVKACLFSVNLLFLLAETKFSIKKNNNHLLLFKTRHMYGHYLKM